MLVSAAHSEKTRYRQPQTSVAQTSLPCDNAYSDYARFLGTLDVTLLFKLPRQFYSISIRIVDHFPAGTQRYAAQVSTFSINLSFRMKCLSALFVFRTPAVLRFS